MITRKKTVAILLVALSSGAVALMTPSNAVAHGPNQGNSYGMGNTWGPGMMNGGMWSCPYDDMGHMMGQGMMSNGMMMDRGMMMRPGMGRQGMMQVPGQQATVADVRQMFERYLVWQGNANLKVGTVEERDDGLIIAEIVTQDGSLVQRLTFDRATGFMQPVQ